MARRIFSGLKVDFGIILCQVHAFWALEEARLTENICICSSSDFIDRKSVV